MNISYTIKAKLARAGIVLLALSPFSIVSFTLQSLIALLSLLIPSPHRIVSQVPLAPRIDRILRPMMLIYLVTLAGTAFSISELIFVDEINIGVILARFGGQQFALVMGFFQVLCGYFLAQYYGETTIRRTIMIPFIIIVCVAGYQYIATATGLPYVGKYVNDRFVGLRPSSLAVEPKYLASYLSCIVFYLGYLFFESTRSPRLAYSLGLIAGLYFFVAAASANGAMIFILLIVLMIFSLPIRWRFAIGALVIISLQAASMRFEAEEFGLRGTHLDLIQNLGAIDLGLLDDLIALPILAWIDNPGKVIFGFGPGLMHFFAARHSDQATWWAGDSYIEGNISLLMYASNFGVVLFGLLLVSITLTAIALVRRPPLGFNTSTSFFFVGTFIAGAVITGNISVPFFISIGWIFGSHVARRSY